jgi:hypothetical protein
MATAPAMTQMRPATTWMPSVVRKAGDDEGIGIPRTTIPSSVKAESSSA